MRQQRLNPSHGLALALLLIASCARAGERAECSAQADVAEQFANQYITWMQSSSGAEMSTRSWLVGNKLASDALLTQFEQLDKAAWQADPELGPGADLLLDAQDFPDDGFEFARCDAANHIVWLRGKSWQDFNVALRLVKHAENWQVDGMGAVNMPQQSIAPAP